MCSMKKIPSVTTIGGGTGSFVVLSGLKNFKVYLNAIVAMTDSGGSTGKLRDQLGILPMKWATISSAWTDWMKRALIPGPMFFPWSASVPSSAL